mmetsp:Transcript_10114/g.26095  ORF Transcript_10114/g.26095 Transcript_10114/m.26095 type:complete len:787 (+) Transcript_10114:250-2610(+)
MAALMAVTAVALPLPKGRAGRVRCRVRAQPQLPRLIAAAPCEGWARPRYLQQSRRKMPSSAPRARYDDYDDDEDEDGFDAVDDDDEDGDFYDDGEDDDEDEEELEAWERAAAAEEVVYDEEELEELKAAENGLSGTLPAQWSAMRLLESLELEGNNLTGGIPEEWGLALTELESLTLGEAQENSCIPPSLLRALANGMNPWLIRGRVTVCDMPDFKPQDMGTSPWLQLTVTVIASQAVSASAAAATTGRRSLQQLDRADLMALSPATREAVELLREDVVELTGLPRVAVAAWSVQEAGGGLEAGGALTMELLLRFPPGATYDELEGWENRLATSKDEFTRLLSSGLQVVHISAEESLQPADDDLTGDDFDDAGWPPRSEAESGSVALIIGATVGAVVVALTAVAGLSFYVCRHASHQQVPSLDSRSSFGRDASSLDAMAHMKGSVGTSDAESPATLQEGSAVRGGLPFKQRLPASMAGEGEPTPGKFFDLSVDWYSDLEGQLGAKLGTGAFGTVYKARWRGQDVAVKVFAGGVNMDSDAQMVSFRDEVKIMAELSNKGCDRIVRMHGACLSPPKVCIIYEYMPGGSLHNRIHNSSQPLTHLDVMRIGLDIAEGLAFLHATTVHRDLKPQNILLGADGRAKICDLGLGRAKDPMKSYLITEAGGTASYMAPEVFSHCKLHDKVDMYALGVILNEMLSRKPPWSNDSWHAAAFQIMYAVTVHKERPEIPKSCPPALATLIRRCWATDSKERPSAAEAAEQLGDLLAAAETGQAAQAATGMLGAAVLTA